MQRHFIGWSRSAPESVCDFLLANAASGQPFDLENTLIVVPTRQAGRRLLDALVLRCDAARSAVLSPRVVTPPQFAADALRQPDIANGAEILAAWIIVLRETDAATLAAVGGAFAHNRDPAAIAQIAARIQHVRVELAEGALTCADVARHDTAHDTEPERWQALAKLESAFFDQLARHNRRDSCAAQIAWSNAPRISPDLRRIVVACVPDPSLLLTSALTQLAPRLDIELLVHAPADTAAQFDAWGRPKPEFWNSCTLDIPDEARNLLPAADPAAQAARVITECAAESAHFSIADVAVGVPDRSVAPFLADHFAARGVTVFDPQETPLGNHPLCRLIQLLLDLRRHAAYRTVADLLRHPDVLAALCRETTLTPAALLTQLDEFQNTHLPLNLEDLLRISKDDAFAAALRRVAQWRDRLVAGPLTKALRETLVEIHAGRTLAPNVPADKIFTAAAEAVDRVLRELEDARPQPDSGEMEDAILTARLHGQSVAPERADEVLDLEGWLELPWNPAPLLFVTGMNDGCVPDGKLSDDFLPDTLRRALGLRDDRLRAARDAFLFRTLIEMRGNRGRVVLLCGKTSAEGDPLRPSRLLFRCDDAHLPQRAMRLFGQLPVTRPSTPATIGFKLNPFVLPAKPLKHELSVTKFRDYLACPFRFYLRHVLKMEPLADDRLAPDERDFGTLVHAVLETFANDPILRNVTDADQLAAHLAAMTADIFSKRFGPHPSLSVQMSCDNAIQRLRAFAVCQAELAKEWEIIAVEKEFLFRRGDWTIKARVDRLDRHRSDGRIRVMDYKTFEKSKNPADFHLGPRRLDAPEWSHVEITGRSGRASKKAWADLQLPLYREALMANGYDAAKIETGYFALPRATGETGVILWDDYTIDLHASAMHCADGVLQAIAADVFWPPRDVPANRDDFSALFAGPAEASFTAPTDKPENLTHKPFCNHMAM